MIAIRITSDVPLVAGETVLLPRRAVRVGSAWALPTCRVFFSLPPLLEVGLLVTDHRIIVDGLCLRLVAQVQSLWFLGEESAREQLESVSFGRAPVLGDYLELRSIESTRHWYRSQRMRLRLFVPGARDAAEIIQRQLRSGGG